VKKPALLTTLALFAAALSSPASAIQCVPYAREVSGLQLKGDAWQWWSAAAGVYERGRAPREGGVLVFSRQGSMRHGHVSVVTRVVSNRVVLVDHANWAPTRGRGRGEVTTNVSVLDVSPKNDWSQVRVWHSPTGQMGARTNPTYGFIYPVKAKLHPFTPDPALGSSLRYASAAVDNRWDDEDEDDAGVPATKPAPRLAMQTRAIAASLSPKPRLSERKVPRLEMDPFIIEYADNSPSNRSLREVIADVKRDSRMN